MQEFPACAMQEFPIIFAALQKAAFHSKQSGNNS